MPGWARRLPRQPGYKTLSEGQRDRLDDVSFDVHANQVTAMIGPSGCGKTTMLRLMAGLEYPSRGDVTMLGQPILGPGPERGMVFQAYTSFPWLTTRANIEYGLKLQGLSRAERRERAEHFLELVASRRVRRRLSGRAFRRHEAARLHRTHAGAEPRAAAAGRAVRRARRPGHLGDGGDDHRDHRAREQDGGGGYPRHPGGDLSRRQDHLLHTPSLGRSKPTSPWRSRKVGVSARRKSCSCTQAAWTWNDSFTR